jgi:hypothetical protein
VTGALAPPLPATPYVGLVPYGEDDAAFFFGRVKEQRVIAGNLRASRLTVVYGPSGVGKTSLLQLVHGARAGDRQRGDRWRARAVRDLRLRHLAR